MKKVETGGMKFGELVKKIQMKRTPKMEKSGDRYTWSRGELET